MSTTESYEVIFGEATSNKEMWKINVSEIELIAGMLAAGAGITEILNYKHRPKLFYLTSTADVSKYRVEQEIEEGEMSSHMIGRLKEGQYGIWCASAKGFRYNLYAFTTPSFFQGLVSVCDNFNVDFRTIIYGQIFDMYGNQYILEDYLMTDYQLAMDVPDSDDDVPDFYSTTDEKEREGDENIITPLELGGFPENNDL
jgi:hypothetical protein